MDRLREISHKYFIKALNDEDFVMRLTNERWGGIVRKASREEDIAYHVDFYWKPDTNSDEIGFDVKGLRKNKRSDNEFNDSITWIELINMKGNKGSIYGEAKYMAFITNDSIVYVPREKIITLVTEKIKDKEVVNDCPNDCYVPYNRRGRKDLIVKVKMDDLKEIAKQILVFNEKKNKNKHV